MWQLQNFLSYAPYFLLVVLFIFPLSVRWNRLWASNKGRLVAEHLYEHLRKKLKDFNRCSLPENEYFRFTNVSSTSQVPKCRCRFNLQGLPKFTYLQKLPKMKNSFYNWKFRQVVASTLKAVFDLHSLF